VSRPPAQPGGETREIRSGTRAGPGADAVIYEIRHVTTYHYSEPVALCHNVVHLTPRICARQACRRTELTIDPEPAVVWTGRDYFDNPATFFAVQEAHRRLTLTARHTIEVFPPPPPPATPAWEVARNAARSDAEACQYLFDSPYVQCGADLAEYARPSFPPGRPLLGAALDLAGRIHREFRYDPGATSVTTPLREVLVGRRGVCQDFAHLAVGCLRSLGLAARYVSGYLRTVPPPGRPRLVGADASHAWASVFAPGVGWLDIDPTNDRAAGEDHVVLGWGRDYDDVSPVKGVLLGSGKHTVGVSVDVEPVG
jgi:transglutaminase-like putative cysteine protease